MTLGTRQDLVLRHQHDALSIFVGTKGIATSARNFVALSPDLDDVGFSPDVAQSDAGARSQHTPTDPESSPNCLNKFGDRVEWIPSTHATDVFGGKLLRGMH